MADMQNLLQLNRACWLLSQKGSLLCCTLRLLPCMPAPMPHLLLRPLICRGAVAATWSQPQLLQPPRTMQ